MTKPAHRRSPAAQSAWRRHSLHRALLVSTMLFTPGWAAAQAPSCGNVCELYSGLLLAPERDLIGSIRTLEKVARPAAGPRNTRGCWVQRDVYLGPEAFDTTFYLKGGQVQRIEMVSTASDPQCRVRTPWSATIATLGTWQSQGAVSGQFNTIDSVQQSVHWASGDLDVSVYRSVSADSCSTKVVFKKRESKDDAEL